MNAFPLFLPVSSHDSFHHYLARTPFCLNYSELLTRLSPSVINLFIQLTITESPQSVSRREGATGGSSTIQMNKPGLSSCSLGSLTVWPPVAPCLRGLGSNRGGSV